MERPENSGSVFRIFLPISTESIPLHPVILKSAPIFEISGTVLLIEDEEPVRHLTAIMLARLGLTVMEAKDGIEAMEMFAQHRDEIHCIFSDMTMPDMGGWELLAAVRKLSPDIPVILSSGYDESLLLTDEHFDQPTAFLGLNR